MTGQKNACPQGERALALYSFLEAIRRRRALLCTGGNPPVTPDQPNNATTQKDRARLPGPLLLKAPPHNSRRLAQAAYRAKIFRGIFQKCSPSHQGLPVLFGSFRKNFPARSTTWNYAVPP
ncbi:hypothetical protein [Gemmiger sp. An50]|uniref:hypothetical protein n=1 Tax=Gemmiger sp. An50 TaxID=1965639 RepID=UPI001123BDE7|nr:hypothetical protein [Gemmiger sp. An50]